MKRDMDLVRLILLYVEKNDDGSNKLHEVLIPDRDKSEVEHHVRLLQEAGLLVKPYRPTSGGPLSYFPSLILRLTWEGHDFLDAARNETIWEKVKAQAKEKAVSLPFEALKAALVAGVAAVMGIK